MASDQPILIEMVARTFKQAMRERDYAVAELLLQALERLNAERRCESVLTEALLAVADGTRDTGRKRCDTDARIAETDVSVVESVEVGVKRLG